MKISCGLCTLRPWLLSDKESLLKHANNYKVWQNLRDRFPHPYTAADAENWLQHTSKQQLPTNFAIEVAGEAVGGIGLELQQDVERVSAELGYWLGEVHWGKGITTAAIKGITAWAIPNLALTRIYAQAFLRNKASIRALEKAGYQLEGILKRSIVKEGQVLDQTMYAFTDLELKSS